MSVLSPGEEQFHYCDNSHRWVPPWPPDPEMDKRWEEMVRAHVMAHLETLRTQRPDRRLAR